MKSRIRQIRQNAGMTQQEFGKQIGVSRNTIATYETSDRVPIDAIQISICSEFNVNELWLKTGKGPMYAEADPDLQLSRWFGQMLREDNSSYKKQLLLSLSRLSDQEWSLLEKLSGSLPNRRLSD